MADRLAGAVISQGCPLNALDRIRGLSVYDFRGVLRLWGWQASKRVARDREILALSPEVARLERRTVMNRFAKIAAGGALATVALSGCYYYGDGYYGRYGYNRPGYYDSYYDGYYGPYYGGYWGTEGDFYYYDADRRYHRDSNHHFRHERFEGATSVRVDRDRRYDRDHDRDYDRDDDYRRY